MMSHYLQLNRSRTCAASPPPSSLLLHSGNGGGRVLLASLQQSLTEVATLLLMLRWRLEPTLPPLQHESARHSLSECERREKSFQISQLIAGVSRRGEKAWLWPLPHCVTTATATQRSSAESRHSGRIQEITHGRSAPIAPVRLEIYMRHEVVAWASGALLLAISQMTKSFQEQCGWTRHSVSAERTGNGWGCNWKSFIKWASETVS